MWRRRVHRRPPGRPTSLKQGHTDVRAVDIKPLDEWYQQLPRRREPRRSICRIRPPAARRSKGAAIGLQPGRRHGRHGLHREQQGPVHAHRADQHAPAAWPPRSQASSASSTPPRPASTPPTSRRDPDVTALKEEDAYPAMPEDGYGWEKLFSERMCRHFREDFGLAHPRRPLPQRLRPASAPTTAAARRRPAAICRKVIEAKLSGNHEIEIWGDGHQTRSFMYIDDCVKGTQDILRQRHHRAAQPRQQRAGDASTSWSTSSRTSPASS